MKEYQITSTRHSGWVQKWPLMTEKKIIDLAYELEWNWILEVMKLEPSEITFDDAIEALGHDYRSFKVEEV